MFGAVDPVVKVDLDRFACACDETVVNGLARFEESYSRRGRTLGQSSVESLLGGSGVLLARIRHPGDTLRSTRAIKLFETSAGGINSRGVRGERERKVSDPVGVLPLRCRIARQRASYRSADGERKILPPYFDLWTRCNRSDLDKENLRTGRANQRGVSETRASIPTSDGPRVRVPIPRSASW